MFYVLNVILITYDYIIINKFVLLWGGCALCRVCSHSSEKKTEIVETGGIFKV